MDSKLHIKSSCDNEIVEFDKKFADFSQTIKEAEEDD